MRTRQFGVWLTLVLVWSSIGLSPPQAAAVGLADPAFDRVWERTDQPVASQAVSRSWLWGPTPLTGPRYERYLSAPGAERLIQYFDKGRMEINNPTGDPGSDWYVTSGLLTRELISGRRQIGDATFLDAGKGANIAVAGDPDNPFPTYANLQPIVDQSKPDQTGGYATSILLQGGISYRPAAQSDPNAQLVHYVSYRGPSGTLVGYNVPRAFWTFMTQPGQVSLDGQSSLATPLFDWLFVLGYPIADPYWVQVRVGGVTQWVLLQPFERRLLTYTPSNPDGWQVEMGNIGLHYLRWRYGEAAPVALDGNRAYFGLSSGDQSTFSTTAGADETWLVTGESRSFLGGSQLVRRLEQRGAMRRATYWSITQAGLDLYGLDELDESGAIASTTVFSPPIHYFPGSQPYIGQAWSTATTVMSSSGPAKQRSVSMQVAAWQRVSTPAGLFDAWKIEITEWNASDSTDPVKTTTTLWLAPSIGTVQWLGSGFAAQIESGNTFSPDETHGGQPPG